MKILIFLIISFVILFINSKVITYSSIQDVVDKINKDSTSTWISTTENFKNSPIPKLMSGEYLKVHFNATQIPKPPKNFRYTFPSSYNVEAASCSFPVRNQGQCGSCWAHAVTGSVASRLCKKSSTKVAIPLSVQELVDCATSGGNQGCNGGFTEYTMGQYVKSTGLVTAACYAYKGVSSGSCPFTSSPNVCPTSGATPSRSYDLVPRVYQSGANLNDVMQNIYDSGSCAIQFSVHYDFYTYSSGVYSWKVADPQYWPGTTTPFVVGGHAVEVVGWGVDGSGVSYWICKNSWGTTSWATSMKGYFWIKRGTNECGIESFIVCPNV